jgi:NAD(P)-dependent dehydrogenase (short-subunit alcohol dehydrogenase family)
VTDDASASEALATIGAAEGMLDVLVHNAGVLGSEALDGPTALRVFDTNAVAAATMLTVQYAKSQPGIKFNAVEPTATDMTAAFGIGRSPAESARTVVRLATLDVDGPTGTFRDETGELPW